jgi:hypothetical protein
MVNKFLHQSIPRLQSRTLRYVTICTYVGLSLTEVMNAASMLWLSSLCILRILHFLSDFKITESKQIRHAINLKSLFIVSCKYFLLLTVK